MEKWNEASTEEVIQKQRTWLQRGKMDDVNYRIQQLQRLAEGIKEMEVQLVEALKKDLGKSEFEAYSTEVGYVLNSIRYTIKHLKRWTKPKRVATPFYHGIASSRIYHDPYGVVLIIGPFNYPFQLLIEPLIGALAAGNSVVLKPSEYVPHITGVMKQLITRVFDDEAVVLIEGEKETTAALLAAPFDYIFFTGSMQVGKIVMTAAAKNLVPVTLELGGKSPVIVDESANLSVAAQRIMWGKTMNAGQTCIAPDYLLVHETVKSKLIDELKKASISFFGEPVEQSEDYGRIVNERQFERLEAILQKDADRIIFGGDRNREQLFISPTLLESKGWDDAALEDELFGPILPIIEYRTLDEAINLINNRAKPLALYLFTENRAVEKKVLRKVSFGGGCVNDTISHAANHNLPFGGVGNSGMGAYHGKSSFNLFSHHKSVLKKSSAFPIRFLFPPYGNKVKWIKKIFK